MSRILAAEDLADTEHYGVITVQLIGVKNVSAAVALDRHGADLFIKEDTKRSLDMDKIPDKIFEIERRLLIKRRPR
jgi:2-methylfumaryl-CoA hydratase